MDFTGGNPWTGMINRKILAPSQCNTVKWFDKNSIDCYKHGILTAKGVDCFQSAYFLRHFFVCFLIRTVLNIQPIPMCHTSNERKQTPDEIYNLLFLKMNYA